MTVLGGQILVLFLVVLQIAAMLFRWRQRAVLAALSLLPMPATALVLAVVDMAKSPTMIRHDAKWAVYELLIVGLILLSFRRWSQACFWAAWVGNLTQLAGLLFLAFFWHAFA